MRLVVLGAGVAGLSSALYLRRDGHVVTVLDPLPPGGGASFGNAGLISSDAFMPLAQPGMLRQVPGWLLDPLGPLAIRPHIVPRAMPWLVRWLAAGRASRVMQIAHDLRDLHRETFACWTELLGAERVGELFRRRGQVHAWETEGSSNFDLTTNLRRKFRIRAEALDGKGLQALYPGLSPKVTSGILWPDNGHVVNPAKAVAALCDAFTAEGGSLLHQHALKLMPDDAGGWLVMTNIANHRCDAVVVAAGAWSDDILRPLGIKLPMQAERGYHVSLPQPSIELAVPISVKSRGFAMTMMDEGLRCAGTVEIAHRDDPPDERRAWKLLKHAKALFPSLEHGTPRLWMGSRPSTPDSLPIIGPVDRTRGLFLCTGHGHFGMTAGPPSGRLLAGILRGNDPKPDARYALQRFH